MEFNFRNSFEQYGLEMGEFLQRHGSDQDRSKWQAVGGQVSFDEDQIQLIRSFKRPMPVLVMAGAWCGDCVIQCPILAKIAAENPLIRLRFIDRDTDAGLAGELKICGASRIPQMVMFDEDFNAVARFGERTLSQYRALAERLAGASCSTGLMTQNELRVITGELLAFVEYSQLVLRFSPRLRERYGD